jgi:hypothetical protein
MYKFSGGAGVYWLSSVVRQIVGAIIYACHSHCAALSKLSRPPEQTWNPRSLNAWDRSHISRYLLGRRLRSLPVSKCSNTNFGDGRDLYPARALLLLHWGSIHATRDMRTPTLKTVVQGRSVGTGIQNVTVFWDISAPKW